MVSGGINHLFIALMSFKYNISSYTHSCWHGNTIRVTDDIDEASVLARRMSSHECVGSAIKVHGLRMRTDAGTTI